VPGARGAPGGQDIDFRNSMTFWRSGTFPISWISIERTMPFVSTMNVERAAR